MAEALWIGQGAGSNFYNVGIGQGTSNGAGQHTDYPQSAIVSGSVESTESAKFFLSTAGDATFHINASAGTTTTNTVHPRSELRELLSDGSGKAAWDGRTGKHYMWGRSRMTAFTDRRPWICFFQVHGSDGSPNTSDLVRIQTEGANGTTTNLDVVARWARGTDDDTRVVLRSASYDQNDWISWQIQFGGDTSADNGRCQIWFDGVKVFDLTSLGQILSYFKTGCYLQDSVAEGAGSGTGGTVEMFKGSLVTWHTGYPAPTQPIFTGADDGLGGGTDTTPPTVPAHLFGIRNSTTALLSWDESADAVGVTGYKVYRSSVEDNGTTTSQLGKVTNGTGTSLSSAAKTVVSKFTAATSGILDAGHSRLWMDSGTGNVEMVVYSDVSGAPGALLATSNTVAVTNTTEAQKDFTFSTTNRIPIGSGTVYWIGFTWPDPGTPSVNWSRDATASSASQNSAHLANPFGTATALSGPIDAFVDVKTSTSGAVLVATVTDTNFLDTGRTNGVAYTYQVSAIDAAANESAKSDAVIVTPGAPDTTAPSVPTGLTGQSGDRRGIVTWNPSTDTDTGVRDYLVYLNGALLGSVTSPAVTLVELTNGSGYVVTVAARDNSLNVSAQSSGITITPSAPAIAGVPFLERELGTGAKLGLEIAFGADVNGDPTTWVWTDVTSDMRANPGIATKLGRDDESSTSNPASFTVQLRNHSGDYSLGGRSKWWPFVRRNTPVRLRIDPADLGGGRVVFMGGANGWTPGWDSLTGKIPVVTLSASGTLRRLGQGDAPLQSAYRRASEANPSVISYWPLEEGRLATTVSPVRGGSNLQIEGLPDWATSDAFYCSDKLLTMKTSRLAVFPAPYANTGKTQVRTLIMLPEDVTNVPNGAILLSVVMTGSIVRWDIVYTNSPGLEIRAYPVGGGVGSELLKSNIAFGILGKPGRLSLELTEAGGGVNWSLSFKDSTIAASAGGQSGTIPGRTAGIVSWIMYGATQNNNDTVFGHLTLQNTITSAFEDTDALIAFQGEWAAPNNGSGVGNSRLERLTTENSVPLITFDHTLSGDAGVADSMGDFDTMGPQLIDNLLTLLHDTEAADDGQLWDGRSNGLAYTTRRRREQGITRLTIDAKAGQLSQGFAPTDDDQRTRNRMDVKRTFGITVSYEDPVGPLGWTNIGFYDGSVTLNIGRDGDAGQRAQWLVAQGTVEGHRYPQVTVDLRVNPKLAAKVLDMVPGDRIDIVNLDTTLRQFTDSSVSLLVEGIAHAITPKTWLATFNCSPFEPWGVGRVAQPTGDTSDMVMRLDTDGSETVGQAETGFTSLNVVSTGAAWTTNSDDYPLVLEVGGLPIRATACGNPTDAGALPVVRSRISGAFDTQVAAHAIAFGTYQPGDLLVVVFANDDQSVTADASAGWTKIASLGATGHLAGVYTRKSTGSDPLIITTSAPSATDPNNLLMEKAFEITSTAENSTKDWRAQYVYIQDIGDGRGLTAGISGFTSADGDMLEIVQNWTNINPNNILAKYVGGLEVCVSVGEGGSASSTATSQLGAQYLTDWATASTDPVWQGVQREYRDRVYWSPAYNAAIADGLGPLGVAIYYDTSTNHGPGVPNSSDGSFDDIRSRTTGTKPSAGGSEVTWLTNFLNLRETVLAGPLFNDAPADGRVPMFRTMIATNQLLLAYTISWNVYGDPFSITSDPPVDGSSSTITDSAQEGTYIALAISGADTAVAFAASGSGTSGTAPATGTLPSANYLGIVALTTDSVGGTSEVFTPPSGFTNQLTRNPGVTTSAAVATSEKTFTAATGITPGGFTLGTSEPWVAFTIAVSAISRQTQAFTVDPLPVPRKTGLPVQLWKPRRLGMGQSRNDLL